MVTFLRSAADDDKPVQVALNLGNTHETLRIAGPGRVLLSTHLDRSCQSVSSVLELRPDEGVILELMKHEA